MVIFLLRRFSAHTRTVVGLALVVLGPALIAVSLAGAASLLVHGVVVAWIGAVVLVLAVRDSRRARLAQRPARGDDGDERLARGRVAGQ